MKAKELAYKIAHLGLEKKGKQIVVIDLRGLTGVTDFFVIISADSDPQMKAISDNIMKKLRDEKILHPAKTFTHERKMGMGETLILLDTTPGSNEILEKMFHKVKSIYYWSSTYGKYNGYLLYCLYSVATPSVPRRLAEAFRKEGLISDFYLFDLTDYEHKYGDFEYLDPKLG